jgi:hypothetical protein
MVDQTEQPPHDRSDNVFVSQKEYIISLVKEIANKKRTRTMDKEVVGFGKRQLLGKNPYVANAEIVSLQHSIRHVVGAEVFPDFIYTISIVDPRSDEVVESLSVIEGTIDATIRTEFIDGIRNEYDTLDTQESENMVNEFIVRYQLGSTPDVSV